jgi:WD40 repeat protein
MADPSTIPTQLASQPAAIEDLAFDPAGERLVTAGQDSIARLWNTDEIANGPAEPAQLRGHEGPLLSVVFSPDGRSLITTSSDHSVRRWDLGRLVAEPIVLPPVNLPVDHFAISGDARHLAGVAPDGTEVLVWDLEDLAAPPAALAPGSVAGISGIAFGDQEGTILGLNAEGNLEGWDEQAEARNLARASLPEPATVSAALADAGGERWVLATDDGELYLWEPAAAENGPLSLPAPEAMIADLLALSADGRWLAAAAEQGVSLYDLDAPDSAPQQLDGPRGEVLAVALNSNGDWLASGGAEGELLVWNLAGDTPRWQRLPGHETNVLALGFGERNGHAVLASGGGLGELKLWDLVGEELPEPVQVAGHPGSVWSVGISPDGRWLITTGEDGAIRLWSLPVSHLVDLACRTAGRPLNQRERERYFSEGERATVCDGGP